MHSLAFSFSINCIFLTFDSFILNLNLFYHRFVKPLYIRLLTHVCHTYGTFPPGLLFAFYVCNSISYLQGHKSTNVLPFAFLPLFLYSERSLSIQKSEICPYFLLLTSASVLLLLSNRITSAACSLLLSHLPFGVYRCPPGSIGSSCIAHKFLVFSCLLSSSLGHLHN